MKEEVPTNNQGCVFLRLRQIIGDPKAKPEPIKPLIPVSLSTWYAGVQSNKFPAPVHLGRCALWRESDILKLAEAINRGELV